MLSFGLKIAWFSLSLSGLLGCWATLLAFGRATGAYWAPILYCIGCTMLEGIFCLGMIWKMDPSRMPKGFCIAQMTFIGLGTFLMTGVAAAFSVATSLTVLKPKSWGDSGKAALAWRPLYFFPVAVFPLLASAIQVPIAIKYYSITPSDDLHCDAHDPLWPRFLSYAGTPFLLSVPCFYLSAKSVIRVFKTNRHLQRSRYQDMDINHFTALPRRPREVRLKPRVMSCSPSKPPLTAGREPLSPALTSPALASRKFHMPFSPPPLTLDNVDSSLSSRMDEQDSPVSASFPTFTHSPQLGTVSIDPDRLSDTGPIHRREDWREILVGSHISESDTRHSLGWNDDGAKSDFECGKEDNEDIDHIYNSEPYTPVHMPKTLNSISRKSRRPPPPNLAPAIRRIILFQFSFTLIQGLACVTTLVDVIKHRPASPFGTQHVALLLAAWGPAIVFGHLPAVRKNLLMFLRFERVIH